jgi:hypothetical protein
MVLPTPEAEAVVAINLAPPCIVPLVQVGQVAAVQVQGAMYKLARQVHQIQGVVVVVGQVVLA